MKTLAILSRKGGTGKTTIAVHLAVAAALAGHTTALIDLDPQASAVNWSDRRQTENPVVISAHAARLPALLKKAAHTGVDMAIIDTAAHAETAALAAARAATYALIPCRPASLDVLAIGATVDIVKLAKVRACIVFNGTPPPRHPDRTSTASRRGLRCPVRTLYTWTANRFRACDDRRRHRQRSRTP